MHLSSRALEAAWTGGLLREPCLDPDKLIAKAARGQGNVLGGGDWREGFTLLAEELERAGLTALGRTIAHGQLLKLLRQRIAATRLWDRSPQIFDCAVKTPVIILGHMRSGTTRLHRLLACDPRFSYTRLHETLTPIARTSAQSIASSVAIQGFLNCCSPHLRRIHPTSALAAEEEFGLHAFSFHGAMFEAQWNVPRFARYCERRDLGPVYREFRQLVQTLRWKRREPVEKVQLLKAPQFMQDLDEVLNAFPGARVLWVRRNMREVVASTASLVWNQQRIQSDGIERSEVGREWLRKTELREERAVAALHKHAVPTLEIAYADMNENWWSETRRIYRFLGYDLPSSAARQMDKVARGTSHKGHHYSAQLFGLADAH